MSDIRLVFRFGSGANHMRLLVFSALLLSLAAPAMAEEKEVRPLGSFKSWNSYSYDEAGKVCFMASKPSKSLPAGAKRSDIFLMVTHRPAQNSTGVVSVVAGYPYKPGSEVELSVGKEKFTLFTEGDTAWARDDATDKAIVQAIRTGSSVTVVGTSTRGTKTTDTYSLAGSGAAHDSINKECGVN
jgi:hypothetical protein